MFETIVISGGTWNAMLILGALMYICEKTDFDTVKTFTGTSSGAILAYLICIGYDPYEIIEYIFEKKVHECMDKAGASMYFSLWQQNYVFEFETMIEPILHDMTLKKLSFVPTLSELFESSGKSFTCYTYNMSTDESVELTKETYPDLSCLKALQMSCSLPMFFDKCYHNNDWYIDGGIQDNFPLSQKNDTDLTLGFFLTDDNRTKHCNTLSSYLFEIFNVPHRRLNEMKLQTIQHACIVKIASIGFRITEKIGIKDILDWISKGYACAMNPHNRNFILV